MRSAAIVSILMPCRGQDPGLLAAAVASVVAQEAPRWELLVLVDPGTSSETGLVLRDRPDPRISIVESPRPGFAAALNTGLHAARGEFACILLSDDELVPGAVRVLENAIARRPDVDFFHSARCYIDGNGAVRTPVMPSRASFRLADFAEVGSPVKHLLGFRRAAALVVGGFDESLSSHGCDDYDFPWTMAEAGYRFLAIPDCLYRYRVHHRSRRLTTDVALEEQVRTIVAMFKKHDVTEARTWRYVGHAFDTYLVGDRTLAYGAEDDRARTPEPGVACHVEAIEERRPEFVARGFESRHFFAHRVLRLPKGGPDGLKMAGRLCGISRPESLRELVLHALPPALDGLPPALSFDDEIVWHRQHLGRTGQVASANLVRDGRRLYGMNYLSDLVQRIGRRPECRSRVDNRFKGWSRMLLNAVLDFACDEGVAEVWSPTAALAMRHTNPQVTVGPALFERVYDRTVTGRFDAERSGDWWRIDVERNRDRVVRLAKGFELVPRPRTVCLCHDIERGEGHLDVDPAFARAVDAPSRDALGKMAAIERSLGLRATYHVVGSFLPDVWSTIEAEGHAVAFHSFDHATVPQRGRVGRALRRWELRRKGRRWDQDVDFEQLEKCRRVDYRLAGYRPPRSLVTPGLADRHLSYFNFEWLASSEYSLGAARPFLRNGIVKIPIAVDDFPLHQGALDFDAWERGVLEAIGRRDFVAVCLHDCYAERWLPQYAGFLEKIRGLARFRTLDEVAAETFLSAARWNFGG